MNSIKTFNKLFDMRIKGNCFKKIYSGDDEKVRYFLGEEVDSIDDSFVDDQLIVIGLNPSSATFNKSDQTISKVKEFSRILKFKSFIMLNLTPIRKELSNSIDDELYKKYNEENLKAFKYVLNLISGKVSIWAAWGDDIKHRKDLIECLSKIYYIISKEKGDVKWFRVGKMTDDDNPRNPSRLSYNDKKDDFNIKKYIDNFKK